MGLVENFKWNLYFGRMWFHEPIGISRSRVRLATNEKYSLFNSSVKGDHVVAQEYNIINWKVVGIWVTNKVVGKEETSHKSSTRQLNLQMMDITTGEFTWDVNNNILFRILDKIIC